MLIGRKLDLFRSGAAAVFAVAMAAGGAQAETDFPEGGGERVPSTEFAPGMSPGEKVEVKFGELPTDPESVKLKDRVEARWQALVDRDFAKAYDYESPAFRERHTPEQYASKYGPNVRWHVATVERIRYDRPGVAKVLVKVDHDFFLPQGDQAVRMQSYLEEDWVNIDGHWWRNATQQEFELPGK